MNEKAMRVYRGILEEIKLRTDAIDDVLSKKLPMRAKIAEELCYLQLRMICELIAIGCLVIHGDVSAKKSDLLKSYKADWIVRVLAQMHPKFYPVALEIGSLPRKMPDEWVERKTGILTRNELIDLYTKHAGNRLHRGSAKNILEKDVLDFAHIQEWRDKVVGLLTRHIIHSPDEEHICYFVMNNGKGQVASNLFQAAPSLAIQKITR